MRKHATTGAVATTHAEAIGAYLEGARVRFEVVEHEPVMTAIAEARATGFAPDQVAKTVLLHDGGGYVIAVIPASQRLDLHKLRSELGATRELQLASEDQIAHDFPAFEVGAVPPFGPIVAGAVVIDQRLLDQPRVLCPAGDHRHSVLVDPGEVVRITAGLTADICQD